MTTKPLITDSHCHLDFPDFEGDLGAFVRRAQEAGVHRMVTICTRLDKERAVRSIAEDHEPVFYAAGTHPMSAADVPVVSVHELVELASHPKFVGIGETGLAFYEAHNPTDRPIAGTAAFNVAPSIVGGYFTKIDCFCFELQVLQPGETVQMPVTFYVDPEIVDDRDAKYTKSITLSYTFYETDLPEEYAELSPTDLPDTN